MYGSILILYCSLPLPNIMTFPLGIVGDIYLHKITKLMLKLGSCIQHSISARPTYCTLKIKKINGEKKTSYAYEGASMTPAIRYYIGQMLYTSGTSISPLLLSLFKWGIRSANCCNRTGAIDNRCVR